MLDPCNPGPRYTGLGNIGGFAPAGAVELPAGTYAMVFGRRCFFGYTVHPSGELWWFANPPLPQELSAKDRAAVDWREHLMSAFADDRGPMTEIINATPGPLFCTNQYELPSVPTWHRGRVVLIGDAAHAAAPSSGQGVSMAAEDALALAHAVRTNDRVVDALASLVRTRRPRAERVVAFGQRYSNTKTVGPVGRWVRDRVLPLVFRLQARMAGPGSLSWLYDHAAVPV